MPAGRTREEPSSFPDRAGKCRAAADTLGAPHATHVRARDLALAVLVGCGAEEPADNAVEAHEQNTVGLGGVRNRAVLFGQRNVHTPPDDALWEGKPPGAGKGL
jgi:hypothetical protein